MDFNLLVIMFVVALLVTFCSVVPAIRAIRRRRLDGSQSNQRPPLNRRRTRRSSTVGASRDGLATDASESIFEQIANWLSGGK